MKFSHILDAVYSKPWLITPASHGNICKVLDAKLSGTLAMRYGEDVCGNEVECDQMEIRDGVAVIPVSGVIGRKLSALERGYGCTDVCDVMDEIDEAEMNPEVKAIVFDIDSPGGMVNGTPELADKIAGCKKTTYAFTAGQMCSAGYWIGSACDMVFATKSAKIGSIGVYCALMDVTKMLEANGVSVEMFKSGQYKGAGYPGVPLTNEQRALFQQDIDEIAKNFKAQVNGKRSIPEECMQGQSFQASQALAQGLIDDIVPDLDELIASI